MFRISQVTLLILALALAACGEQATESSDASAPTTSEPPSSEPASIEPDASEAPDGSQLAFPSFDIDGDPELAGRFPETVDGQPLQVISMRGDMFAGEGADESFQDFLDSIGADLEDVSVAFGGVASEESFVSVAAFRVLGASEDELLEEFVGATEESGEITGLEPATVGGKEVLAATDSTGELGGGNVFVYAQDDTLYWMTGTEDQAAEILEALP